MICSQEIFYYDRNIACLVVGSVKRKERKKKIFIFILEICRDINYSIVEIFKYLRCVCDHNHMVAEFHLHIQSVLRTEKNTYAAP